MSVYQKTEFDLGAPVWKKKLLWCWLCFSELIFLSPLFSFISCCLGMVGRRDEPDEFSNLGQSPADNPSSTVCYYNKTSNCMVCQSSRYSKYLVGFVQLFAWSRITRLGWQEQNHRHRFEQWHPQAKWTMKILTQIIFVSIFSWAVWLEGVIVDGRKNFAPLNPIAPKWKMQADICLVLYVFCVVAH